MNFLRLFLLSLALFGAAPAVCGLTLELQSRDEVRLGLLRTMA
jgi:hypothetical protein